MSLSVVYMSIKSYICFEDEDKRTLFELKRLKSYLKKREGDINENPYDIPAEIKDKYVIEYYHYLCADDVMLDRKYYEGKTFKKVKDDFFDQYRRELEDIKTELNEIFGGKIICITKEYTMPDFEEKSNEFIE